MKEKFIAVSNYTEAGTKMDHLLSTSNYQLCCHSTVSHAINKCKAQSIQTHAVFSYGHQNM